MSPDWINDHVYKKPELRINIAFPVNDPTLPVEIGIEDLKIYPRIDRLEIIPNDPTEKSLGDAAFLASEILSHLSHTPITAIGINFGFSEDDISLVAGYFNLADSANIDRNIFSLMNTNITRSFKLERDHILNLSINYGEDKAFLGFNYHHNFQTTKDAVEFLKAEGQTPVVEKYYRITKSFIRTVYDIDLGEDDEWQ